MPAAERDAILLKHLESYTLEEAAAVLGTLILSLISLIPFVAIVTGILAILGSGAFVYRAFESAKNPTIPAVPGWSVQS